jgi:hypothetical protein
MSPKRQAALGVPLDLVAFSPNGSKLLAARVPLPQASITPNEAFVFDVSSGKRVGGPIKLPGMLRGAHFTADDRSVVTYTYTLVLQGWDATTGGPVGKAWPRPRQFALRPDKGEGLAYFGEGAAYFQRIDLTTGERFGPKVPAPRGVLSLALSADGRTALCGCFDRTARRWDLTTGKQLGRDLRTDGLAALVACAPGGRVALTACLEGHAVLWDLKTGRGIGPSLAPPGRGAGPWRGAFSPGGELLATAGGQGNVHLWHAATATPVGPPLPHPGEVTQVGFAKERSDLLTTCEDSALRHWGVYPPLKGAVEEITLWAQVLTGLEMDTSGVVRPLGDSEWQKRRARLAKGPGRDLP